MALRAVSAIFFQDESVFGDAVWRADALARHANAVGVVSTAQSTRRPGLKLLHHP